MTKLSSPVHPGTVLNRGVHEAARVSSNARRARSGFGNRISAIVNADGA